MSTKKSELFIALIGPVGTDLKKIYDLFERALYDVKYSTVHIKLSTLINQLKLEDNAEPLEEQEFDRIERLMKKGDAIRSKAGTGAALAQLAVAEIAFRREQITGNSEDPAFGTAYILDSIKHDAEIELLRKTYGPSLWVVSVYETYGDRIAYLLDKNEKAAKRDIAMQPKLEDVSRNKQKAKDLLLNDRGDSRFPLGQNVAKAFHLADFFISRKNESVTGFDIEKQINRFIGLLFGAPFFTPTKDEYGSFYAHAASLRSADLSRQVGAIITTKDGELIAAGCNEVPSPGGGAYWEGCTDVQVKDYRDFKLGADANAVMKNENVREIIEAFRDAGWLAESHKDRDVKELIKEALYQKNPPAFLKETGIANIIEFGRIVHAEMTAITEAARRGLALKNATLYTTTFPCHVCARHILAVGIDRVVYIEPYPKSHAGSQYKSSIRIDDDPLADANAIQFDAFLGVAPKVFIPLFTKVERKDSMGNAVAEDKRLEYPKIGNNTAAYIELELEVIANLLKQGIIKNEGNSNTRQRGG